MGLWRFVVARGITYDNATEKVKRLLARIKIEDLQAPSFWKTLTVLVKIQPEEDILPVRAEYGSQNQYSIGLNYLTCEKGLWFTLADCIASTLLTGKPPRIIEAIRFRPKSIQKNLNPLRIMGKSNYRIDPAKDDFYRRLIDLRSEVKAEMEKAKGRIRQQLDIDQLTLKICANATSYGIFVELNPITHRNRANVRCYSAESFEAAAKTTEQPGKYFHPLLSTLITGAARLMLAVTEELAKKKTIEWAMCDTDSMALAKPEEMSEIDFSIRTKEIIDWFIPLNPYKEKGQLLKIENINFHFNQKKFIVPLYCWAISAKRYALFNLAENGKPIIRKASAHGLGHLLPPYEDKYSRGIPRPSIPLSEIGVSAWQYDFWYFILESVLNGRGARTEFHKLPNFNKPAVSRYSASTPSLLNWFAQYNVDKSYRDRVKPFNFLVASQAKLDLHKAGENSNQLSPIAPYDRDNGKALRRCFDRISGRQVLIRELKTYCELLNQYHLHPEAKFQNGDYLESGVTERRHIIAVALEYIGKEANRLEEQWFLGVEDDARILYGFANSKLISATLREKCSQYGQRELAEVSGLSSKHLARVLAGKAALSLEVQTKLQRGFVLLQEKAIDHVEFLSEVNKECSKYGLRKFSARVRLDPSNLAKILKGKRTISTQARAALTKAFRH